ncbi:MAG: outer membrane beta-barrel protein [Saprospiraceae bacterium]|nr:outer membrane beta-barrel protein [Saprospiraceae bacterium]MDW8230022.1 outer membrane beta-barrel protein [Saprospiraceae bacterium]
MERPEHELDRQFRRRLQYAEVPPPPAVWEGVSAALRRRRRRVVFWWLTGLFLLGAASIGVWQWRPTPTAQRATLPHNEANHPYAPSAAQALPAPDHSAATPATVVPCASAPYSALPPAQPSAVARSPRQASFPPEPQTSVAELPTPPAPVVETSKEADPPLNALPAPAIAALPLAPRLPEMAAVPLAARKSNAQNTKKCYSFSDKGGVWMFDAYGGPSWSLPQWRVHDSELDTYAAARRRTETPDGAFNAGLRASYFIHPNIALRTGLHYDHWVERFEYFDPDFIRYHIVITQKLINGQWVSVTDTVGVEYGSEYQKTYNRFGLLDIPLQVGAEWRKGAMGLSLNAGASLNILFHKRGSILDTNGKPVSFTPGRDGRDVYRPRVGWSAGGSIQWFYHVASHTRIFAEPYLRVVLRPITLPSYPIEQRQSIVGLRVGVSQILGKNKK